tara:strand:- start:14626 stop:17226 length:2601 start_codon:yes stop_codon:yes gene_type:complete
MLLDPKVYVCSRTGADKVGYFAKAGDTVDEFLSDDSDYDIYLNGHTVKAERDYVLQDGDMVHAIHRPAGIETYVAVALIVAIITIATLPKPEKPNTQGASSTSPNNQVSGQTNIARTGEGIPDIKGTIRAFPDLIQSSWYTWEENRRRVRERFCVGSSSLLIADVKDNDVFFSDIAGSTATIVEREVQVGDVYPVISDLVTDASLEAENERILDLDYVYLALDGGVNYVIVHSKPESDIVTLLDLNNESAFSVTGTGKPFIDKEFTINKSYPIYVSSELVNYISVGGGVEVRKNCYRIPVTVASNFPAYQEGSCTSAPTGPGGTTASCFPDYIKNGYPQEDADDSVVIGAVSVGVQTDGFTGWSKLNNKESTFNWYLNLLFPSGLILKNGNSESISFRIQARDSVTLAPADFVVSVSGVDSPSGNDVVFSVAGRTGGQLGRTININQSVSVDGNIVEFRIRRDSNIDLNLSTSYVKIETAYVINDYKVGELGALLTLVDVDARSDFTNKTQSSRKINMLASRNQTRPIYSGGGWVQWNGYEYDWFSDAILSDFIELFGWAKTQKILDLDSLYTAMASVPNELKQFNYSYDDADISLGQRIATACNAARVGAYRDGQVWRFYREESKPVTFHFDRRNIAGNAESQMSFRFQKPNDHDSVSLSYIDPVDNKERHIERRINGTNDGFEAGLGVRPLEIDLAGCRNTAQATNRAELEVRRLVYQRRTVSERVLDDGLLVDIGDRVRWACIYDGDIVDGEVLEVSGSQLRISEKLRLTGSLVGHITDINGDVHGPYPITAGANGDFWIDGFDTTKAFMANNMPTQLGSRVIIGTTINLDYYDFTVTSKTPNSDGTVKIEMIEYNELMFSED